MTGIGKLLLAVKGYAPFIMPHELSACQLSLMRIGDGCASPHLLDHRRVQVARCGSTVRAADINHPVTDEVDARVLLVGYCLPARAGALSPRPGPIVHESGAGAGGGAPPRPGSIIAAALPSG